MICNSFSRNNVCKKLSFPSGIFWTSFVELKKKKPFVSLNNEGTEASPVIVSSPPIYFSLHLLPMTRFPENGRLLLIGLFEERNAELE